MTASNTFGLLIPDLGEGEIFEPICQGMARAGKSSNQALLWGNSSEAEKNTRAEELCNDFISKQVSGVFFAPLELSPGMEKVNTRIVSQLERANIPIVLLDRGTSPFPDPSGHDLVGIDNWREGFRMADYLLELGCRKLGFVVRPNSAPTIDARIAGLNQALWGARNGARTQLDPLCRSLRRNRCFFLVGAGKTGRHPVWQRLHCLPN